MVTNEVSIGHPARVARGDPPRSIPPYEVGALPRTRTDHQIVGGRHLSNSFLSRLAQPFRHESTSAGALAPAQEATVPASLSAALHRSLVRPSEKDGDLGRLPPASAHNRVTSRMSSSDMPAIFHRFLSKAEVLSSNLDVGSAPPSRVESGFSPSRSLPLAIGKSHDASESRRCRDIEVTIFQRPDHEVGGPGLFYIHDGGMIMGDRFTDIQTVLPWVRQFDAVGVTVEYRLALEHPDPVPVEDSYAGLLWTAAHAAELGFDGERLVVAGGSAGGGLAAGVSLLARDRRGPRPLGSMLFYPMLDDRNQTVSSRQYVDTGTWSRGTNDIGWDALLGERRLTDQVSIYAAPTRAADLSGLPPTFVDCGSAEVFRDEDIAYASGIWKDGGVCELHVWPGAWHGPETVVPDASVSRAMVAARTARLRRLLGE
jgi:acetyl esterase/lipase